MTDPKKTEQDILGDKVRGLRKQLTAEVGKDGLRYMLIVVGPQYTVMDGNLSPVELNTKLEYLLPNGLQRGLEGFTVEVDRETVVKPS